MIGTARVSRGGLERRPALVTRFHRDDFLRFPERERERERLAIGQRLVAGEATNAPTDGVIALAMPANELFRLLLVNLETRHRHTLLHWLR